MDPEQVLQPENEGNPVDDLEMVLAILDSLHGHLCDYHEGVLDSAMTMIEEILRAITEGDEDENKDETQEGDEAN